MPRLARVPLPVPAGAEIAVDAAGTITVKGKLGELSLGGDPNLAVSVEGAHVTVKRKRDTHHAFSLEGTYVRRIANMLKGVSEGCRRELELHGTGYRASLSGSTLKLELGYSHPISYELPAEVSAELPAPTRIVIVGIDKVKVGQVAADIRKFRPPEPYKGKGARYLGEHIAMKETKKK